MEDTFEYDGMNYKIFPTLLEFMSESGLSDPQIVKVMGIMERAGISRSIDLFDKTFDSINKLVNGNSKISKIIFNHIQLIRHRGRIVKNAEMLEQEESKFSYLETTSTEVDLMLTYSNGQMGLRSHTVVEFYGPAGVGKTQMCMTLACQVMKQWKKSVGYIDSEGAFEYSRFTSLANYWGVENMDEKIYVANVINFDELEFALSELEHIIITRNMGVIIIDSIIDPLKSQYPLDDNLANLQPRQQHLKKVLDRLKMLAKIYGLLIIYTNQVRASIDDSTKEYVPQGGNVMAHASDIRISLELKDEKKLEEIGIKLGIAKVVDCGFLPFKTGKFLIAPFGIADPFNKSEVIDHTQEINNLGFIGINVEGDILPRKK